ncbi:Serinc-domain containing serine and sphingolipid biosynthesis protein [Arabidopsis thaliana]|uniref:Serinc-domain containing serine and sphingolipid biosynthesis protein n=2 Tax=Arabidopsis thaliana TaxID=3702 RepID=F4JT04_ARATH|nr:Serinc-domain containing serine and sphingolipid biosynthesis protein [Arabidopsis thaliana]NP_849373.1 Serinc-domain containing serine and sphingolipid biosynthesis protein [Arabidopsis thaliana]AEE83267.1 Serinc-domain containing serine and sphingolipid biosynthesis protein [Arabidopsis thaliana]ANM66711.1 Serinc-domain containing serine and sphingolipid biosynthesis protein [Arabidopsis thaliana]|eukprot:NP_001328591.1 Serinc-domain containing serine and sphingolipid biosynthesis protein [Arabidopsis thaliana]
METGTSIDNTGYEGIKNGSWFIQFRNGCNPWMARYVYGLIFLLANLLAWALRDYGRGALTEMRKFKNCKEGGDCLGTEGVLRVSFGCFLFYFIMFLSTVGTSKTHSSRDKWHSGWWFAKLFMLLGLTIFPFLLPSSIIQFYGEIAHFGAGVFLLIQLISIISFITWLNECFQAQKDAERCHVHVMLLATTAYTVCILGVILMYIWYVPEPSCLLNIFFITWTLFLIQLMTSISLHPKINAGFLTPALMGLYVVFICWCAIRRQPVGETCNRKAEGSSRTDWLTIISFVVALLAMVIATFSTGVDSQCFQFRKDENHEEDAIPYGYGFFHFVFATGAMYFAMLLVGWNIHHSMKKWTIDVGWTSTWVRIVNEWLAVGVYIWMLVAPMVLKSRQTT